MRPLFTRGPRGIAVWEIVVAVVILGIVAAIAVPRLAHSRAEQRRKAHEVNKLRIDEAVERYYINENQWPANDLSDIGGDPNYFPEGLPVNPTSERPYALNPATHRAE